MRIIEAALMESMRFKEVLDTFHVDQWDGTVMQAEQQPTKNKKKKRKKKKGKTKSAVEDNEAETEGGEDDDGDAAAEAAAARAARVDLLQHLETEEPEPAEAASAATLVAPLAAAAAESEAEHFPEDLIAEKSSEAVSSRLLGAIVAAPPLPSLKLAFGLSQPTHSAAYLCNPLLVSDRG